MANAIAFAIDLPPIALPMPQSVSVRHFPTSRLGGSRLTALGVPAPGFSTCLVSAFLGPWGNPKIDVMLDVMLGVCQWNFRDDDEQTRSAYPAG